MDLAETVDWSRLEETSNGRERPIIFSGAMIRAILDGRKTMTRRVVTPSQTHAPSSCHWVRSGWAMGRDGGGCTCLPRPRGLRCPASRGDRLWVREAFSPCVCDACREAWPEPPDPASIRLAPHTPSYAADCKGPSGILWRPSIHMPRWASRIMLVVESVRVERVQDITEEDAEREGVQAAGDSPCCTDYSHYEGFRRLWDSINAKRGFGWDTNPWVWVIQFKRLQQERDNA